MKVPDFVRGPIAPVFTIFRDDGSLDPEGQRRFLEFLETRGAIRAYVVRSGLGQMYTFRFEEVRLLAETARRHLRDRAPLIVGCSGIWDRNRNRYPDPEIYLREAVELSRFARGIGAAGAMHVVPEAIRPRPGETIDDVIFRYFETVGRSVDLPVFAYEPPGTDPAYGIDADRAARLAAIPNVVGMKLSSADAGRMLDILWATRGRDFGFIVGNETAFLAGLLLGARAVMGQGACVNPRILDAVRIRYENGDIAAAMDAQRSVNLLVRKCPDSVEFLKRYATEKGYPVSPVARSEGSRRPAPPALTVEAYRGFRDLLERELARYE